jgi:16S rRNA (guanine527-N7)-methyltransferase
MLTHLGLVSEWNARTNLTAIRAPLDMVVKHVLDSLTALKVFPEDAVRVLDIGSGAGFPGFPLALARPNLAVTLLDRNPKKIVFLKHAARELGLTNTTIVMSSIEDHLASSRRPAYDVVVFRAWAPDATLGRAIIELLAPRGSLIRMTGPVTSQLAQDHGDLHEVEAWEGVLPFSDARRRVARLMRTL